MFFSDETELQFPEDYTPAESEEDQFEDDDSLEDDEFEDDSSEDFLDEEDDSSEEYEDRFGEEE